MEVLGVPYTCAITHFEWELHPYECVRCGGRHHGLRHAPWGAPLSSSQSTPPREGSLSPSRIYSPWSQTSEIHVPGGYSSRKSCASAASLERGGGGCSVPRTCVRARMRCCFAALGLPLDLEIGKRSSTSTTSLYSLSFVGLQGYVLYGYTSARCLYLVDRSWYIVVPIVGNFLFSMLRTLHTPPREGSLSPSRIYSPWSQTSEIHVPGGYSSRKSCASAASLERGGGGCSVPRTCVRARMRCCFAALGLPLDLEIGKRSSTSTTSLYSLSFVGLQGYVLYGYTSARCLYLVDRSWYIVVPIVGNFLFSMLRTLHMRLSVENWVERDQPRVPTSSQSKDRTMI